MFVRYVPYAGERVSRAVRDVLRSADRHGVRFSITEGHRTMVRQAWFRMCFLTKRCNNGNLAAVPSCAAPHIACGRANHAIDVKSSDGGADRLADFLRSIGIHTTFPVAGESWHMEIDLEDLKRVAKQIRKTQRAKARRQRRRKAREAANHR